MRTISVGELRQNPTRMLADVEAGEVYVVTRHNREVARIVPPGPASRITPPKRRGEARTSQLPRIQLPDRVTIDALLEELKGDW